MIQYFSHSCVHLISLAHWTGDQCKGELNALFTCHSADLSKATLQVEMKGTVVWKQFLWAKLQIFSSTISNCLFLPADCPLKRKAVYVKTESCLEAAVSWKCSHGLFPLLKKMCRIIYLNAFNLTDVLNSKKIPKFNIYDLNTYFRYFIGTIKTL